MIHVAAAVVYLAEKNSNRSVFLGGAWNRRWRDAMLVLGVPSISVGVRRNKIKRLASY